MSAGSEAQTKKEISAMPIHYDIETDALYLEGKGIGLEEGSKRTKYNLIVRLLRQGLLPKEMIASAAEVDLAVVLQIEQDLVRDGNN